MTEYKELKIRQNAKNKSSASWKTVATGRVSLSRYSGVWKATRDRVVSQGNTGHNTTQADKHDGQTTTPNQAQTRRDADAEAFSQTTLGPSLTSDDHTGPQRPGRCAATVRADRHRHRLGQVCGPVLGPTPVRRPPSDQRQRRHNMI